MEEKLKDVVNNEAVEGEALENEVSENDMEEYVTFTITSKEGEKIELAVVDEFEFEKKNYVAAAVVEGDEINEDSVYIYKVKPGTEFAVDKITEPGEYERIASAYLAIEE